MRAKTSSDGLYGFLLGHAPSDAADWTRAAAKYAALVLADGERLALGSAGASEPDAAPNAKASIWTQGLRQQV